MSGNATSSGFSPGRPIIFFDGPCPLCNRVVAAIARGDRRRIFLFAPIQGQTAAGLLPHALRENPATLVLWDTGRLFTKSTAAMRIAAHMGGIWKAAGIFRLIPVPVRDRLYDWVARNRHKWPCRGQACGILEAPAGRYLP